MLTEREKELLANHGESVYNVDAKHRGQKYIENSPIANAGLLTRVAAGTVLLGAACAVELASTGFRGRGVASMLGGAAGRAFFPAKKKDSNK